MLGAGHTGWRVLDSGSGVKRRVYVDQIRSSLASIPKPPEIIIEVLLDGGEAQILSGTNNLANADAYGVRIRARLSEEYSAEYQDSVNTPNVVTEQRFNSL
jgi:hypothetical protein